MVDGIVAGIRTRVLLNDHLERLRELRGLFRRPTQPEEGGIECGDVLLENLRRVALWIGGDEKHLNLAPAGAQLSPGDGQLTERRRADVGTMGVSEEHSYHLAAEIR